MLIVECTQSVNSLQPYFNGHSGHSISPLEERATSAHGNERMIADRSKPFLSPDRPVRYAFLHPLPNTTLPEFELLADTWLTNNLSLLSDPQTRDDTVDSDPGSLIVGEYWV